MELYFFLCNDYYVSLLLIQIKRAPQWGWCAVNCDGLFGLISLDGYNTDTITFTPDQIHIY